MRIETYIVDSFTDRPFKGNPAGVCYLDKAIAEDKMQSIAKELGFSETAFIRKLDLNDSYSIRYFSPVMEIPLCGHATLAASKILFELHPELLDINFRTIENLDLNIRNLADTVEMKFPVYDTVPQDVPAELLRALGITCVKNSVFNKETRILLLEIASCLELEQLSPDFEQLKRTHDSINGVLVTAISQKADFDFESRYFWPWSGTNEDPVTGGTHTFLTKYWADKLGKRKMNSFQCSERTGFMEVEILDNHSLAIRGSAQIVLKGELRV